MEKPSISYRRGIILVNLKILLIVLLVTFISGCGYTTKGNIIRDAVRAKAQVVAEQSLRNTVYLLCDAVPRATLRRFLAGNVERTAHYVGFCNPGIVDTLRAISGNDN